MTQRIRPGTVAAIALLLAAATGCTGQQPTTPAPSGPPAARGAGGQGADGPRPFTLLAAGDVLPHSSVIDQAAADAGGAGYDFAPMLAGVAPVVSGADLAFCHMETVYGKEGGPYTGYPSFKSPPEIATALRTTGFDSCSTASNHTLDDGAEGVRRTLDALDGAGIRHAGSARTAAEAARPTILPAGPGKGAAKVAHLAYTYGTNDIPLPTGRPWTVNVTDERKIVEEARAARRAGADVVVLSAHWGTEWQDEPDAQQQELAERLTASTDQSRPDIDLIIGTHAHVPQAYEKVNGTWVVYGMGDQIAGAMINYEGAQDPRGNQSSMGRFTFAPPAKPGERWKVKKAEFVPQWYDTVTGRAVNLNASLDGDEGAEHLREVRDRIRTVVLGRGADEDGLLMGK
ncbi:MULTISPECIES: CapA family protein [Streptomyces albovinaceus subgroup]|uniref:Lipoprotein n=4 Tax=Streptomyces TaxID=1883 RepID=A0ABM9H0Q1_STRGL|nr:MULTISPECIES: CapA family protein [Streptomyces]RDL07222.1 poly-gamma-glutamate synthesis protein (capsule biosynthesis protein) [Streptomyces sp. HB202]WSF75054.1 CapA family protein [Streptomyces globisporus]WSV88236.1 CapA family protein [Streptomyces globisporus]CAH9417152.1 Lipoprotein [Streptomyces globisporus]